jgi:hypothetical protein
MSTLDEARDLGGVAHLAATASAAGTPIPAVPQRFWAPALGRSFFHPVVDIVFICGAFSLPLLLLSMTPWGIQLSTTAGVALLVAFNYAHFASSTVRLYTKPGAAASHPFLAYGFPLVALAVTMVAVLFPVGVGQHLVALAITWGPYHYAAQAYGLALMYSYRSGMTFSPTEKRWLWWICMLPFLRALINIDDTSLLEPMGVAGATWLLPGFLTSDGSLGSEVLRTGVTLLTPAVFVLPVLFACVGRSRLSAIALTLVLVNALWMTAFSLFDAVVWATVAHSVQYLFVVSHVHAKDAARSQTSSRGTTLHMTAFYGLSALVGIPLFFGVPFAIQQAGGILGQELELSHCYLMVVAAINLHHFIVDGYIWRSTPKLSTPTPSTLPHATAA